MHAIGRMGWLLCDALRCAAMSMIVVVERAGLVWGGASGRDLELEFWFSPKEGFQVVVLALRSNPQIAALSPFPFFVVVFAFLIGCLPFAVACLLARQRAERCSPGLP